MSVVQFTQVLSRGYGMNFHKKVLAATVQGDGVLKETRSCDTFTRTLTQMREWLVSFGYHSCGYGKHRSILKTDIQCV